MRALFLRFCLYTTFALTGFCAHAQKPVSFAYNESLIYVQARINGSRTNYTFLLNTGANKTVLDTRVAKSLKLPVLKEIDTVMGTAGHEQIAVCKVASLQSGTATVKNMEVTMRNLNTGTDPNGKRIDGILGTDFLQHTCINIDFKNQKIGITPQKPASITSKQVIPFDMKDGIPRFRVKLDDTLQTAMHYNSGVSLEQSRNIYVNVSNPQFTKLKKINPHLKHIDYIKGKGVGGDLNLEVIKINMMTLNDRIVRHPYIIVQPQEGYFKQEDAIGFFGNNLLEKYNTVAIDFRTKKLYIKEVPPKKKPVSKKTVAVK